MRLIRVIIRDVRYRTVSYRKNDTGPYRKKRYLKKKTIQYDTVQRAEIFSLIFFSIFFQFFSFFSIFLNLFSWVKNPDRNFLWVEESGSYCMKQHSIGLFFFFFFFFFSWVRNLDRNLFLTKREKIESRCYCKKQQQDRLESIEEEVPFYVTIER